MIRNRFYQPLVRLNSCLGRTLAQKHTFSLPFLFSKVAAHLKDG
jgi:hypothetical protein